MFLPSSTFLIPGINSYGLGHYMRRNSPFFTFPLAPHRRRVQITHQVQGVLGFMKPKLEFIDKVKSKFKGGKTEDEKEMGSSAEVESEFALLIIATRTFRCAVLTTNDGHEHIQCADLCAALVCVARAKQPPSCCCTKQHADGAMLADGSFQAAFARPTRVHASAFWRAAEAVLTRSPRLSNAALLRCTLCPIAGRSLTATKLQPKRHLLTASDFPVQLFFVAFFIEF